MFHDSQYRRFWKGAVETDAGYCGAVVVNVIVALDSADALALPSAGLFPVLLVFSILSACSHDQFTLTVATVACSS